MTQMHRFRSHAAAVVVAWAVTQAALAVAAPAPGQPREVALWPEGSRVLQDGMRELADESDALTHPSFLLYSPRMPSPRPAVLVFPGGGYKVLAIGEASTIGRDGADVCRWLTDAGFACVLVKYRVPNTGCSWDKVTRRHVTPEVPMALQDAQRAMSLVRYHASEFGIDPNRVGVMGFSAGGNLAVMSSTAFERRAYDPVDEADHASLRPDFAIPVYPGHLTMEHKNKLPKAVAAQELNVDIRVSADVPPTLLIHAKDDPIDPVHYSLVYERELKKAGADVKLILYETGGHAFGVKKQGTDTDRWTDDALAWLQDLGIMGTRTVNSN